MYEDYDHQELEVYSPIFLGEFQKSSYSAYLTVLLLHLKNRNMHFVRMK